MSITARLEQSQADSIPQTPMNVREFVEIMEAGGVRYGFRKGVFYEDHTNVNEESSKTIRARKMAAGISNDDLKAFFIAASRPGPSPVRAPKTLFDVEAFKQRLGDLDPKDLVEVFDGLIAASNAMQGILNRPRCQEGAGEQLEHLLDDLCAAYSAIVSEIETRELTYENALQFFHIAAAYEVHCEAPPMTLASIAVKYAEASTL